MPRIEELPPVALSRSEVSRIHALRGVPIDAVWGLLERCPLRELEPGDVLLHVGQANDRMYFVLEGTLLVRLLKL